MHVINGKQKDVHGRGPSNINPGIFDWSFDVYWALQPSINYDVSELLYILRNSECEN